MTRDEFSNLFCGTIENWYDILANMQGEPIKTDSYYLFFKDEEYYFIDVSFCRIINFYKHVGRSFNLINIDTVDDLKQFLTELKEELDEIIK